MSSWGASQHDDRLDRKRCAGLPSTKGMKSDEHATQTAQCPGWADPAGARQEQTARHQGSIKKAPTEAIHCVSADSKLTHLG